MVRVKCLECQVELTSKSRHDFQRCQCPNQTFVDGGGDPYWRVGGVDLAKTKVISCPPLTAEEPN